MAHGGTYPCTCKSRPTTCTCAHASAVMTYTSLPNFQGLNPRAALTAIAGESHVTKKFRIGITGCSSKIKGMRW